MVEEGRREGGEDIEENGRKRNREKGKKGREEGGVQQRKTRNNERGGAYVPVPVPNQARARKGALRKNL